MNTENRVYIYDLVSKGQNLFWPHGFAEYPPSIPASIFSIVASRNNILLAILTHAKKYNNILLHPIYTLLIHNNTHTYIKKIFSPTPKKRIISIMLHTKYIVRNSHNPTALFFLICRIYGIMSK